MKKIFSIFALAIITAAGFTACNDDDNEWVDPNGEPLKVISNETSFSAPASTGSIVVDTQDPVTVTSNDNGWVTTTVNGNTIEVAVEENRELDGRVATLTIKAGSKKTDVSIVQSGAIFKIDLDHIYRSSNSAYTTSAKVTANLPVTFAASSNWITATYDEEAGALTVKLTANTTKHMRQGYIEYTCGNASGRIPVKQCVFSTDLVGDYRLNFTDPSDNGGYYIPAKVSGTQTNCKLEIPAYDISIPMTYSSTDFTFTLTAGQEIGTFNYKNVDHILGTLICQLTPGSTSYSYTWDTKIGMTGAIENGYLSSGDLVTLAQFKDNGSWAGKVANALYIELFTKTPINQTNRAKVYLLHMQDPYLLRVDVAAPTANDAASASPKSLKSGDFSGARLIKSLEPKPCPNNMIAY